MGMGVSMVEVIKALDEYTEARRDLENGGTLAECGDWDCGFSREFDDSFALSYKKRRVEEAKAALGTALDRYIEDRVKAVLRALSGT